MFLGGLLKPLSEMNADTNPDYVQYEFMEGVRELLVDSVPSNYVLNVVDEVSKYVAEKAGLSLENFVAVLRNPQQVRDSHIADDVAAFAIITARVLKRLGGEYIRLAEELERDNRPDYQRNFQTPLDSLPDIEYKIGGCLSLDSPTYIRRKADFQLHNAVKEGQFCILSAPRQMGKSSLIQQEMKHLEKEGFACALIDLAIFGTNITEEQWYISFIEHLVNVFELDKKLDFDINIFFKKNKKQIPSALLVIFLDQILLKTIAKNIVIFLDETDFIFMLSFKESLFSLMRALLDRRVQKNNYNYLNFVLSGVFLDSDLIQNVNVSPLTNIATKIKLEGFTYEEALALASGLAKKTNNSQKLLREILEWTGGQPFLTQKLCQLVKNSEEYIIEGNEKAWLDNLVKAKIIEDWKSQDTPTHLLVIQNRILYSKRASKLLSLYMSILQEAEYDRVLEIIQELMLTGLIVRREGVLRLANKIYAEVFNLDWVEQSLARLSSTTLSSNPEIDYTKLRNLLAEKNWMEADEETFRLMLKATNREKEGTLDYQAIKKIPCKVLNTTDNLWINASQRRFGFSIQLKKWQAAGGKANKETEYKLGNDIGWYVNDVWLSDISEFTFDLSAPVGHLPVKWTFYLGGFFPERQESVLFSDLANRLLSCNINNLEEIELQINQFNIENKTNLLKFNFATVTVNSKGEIIKTESKKAHYFTEILPNNILLEMVAIPAGTFMMGSPEGEGIGGEKPQHEVTVQPFFIGKYPITQAQWRAVANLPKVNRELNPNPSQFQGDNRPVERVSWYDAVEFCDRLSQFTGRQYRLPSEAEWEYACRAGTITPFCFGETLTPDLATYGSNGSKWHSIKYHDKNPISRPRFVNNFGLYDMHGTVWEWCADAWHNNYEGAPTDGSIWINKNHTQKSFQSRFVVRGGSWGKPLENCRSAYRSSEASDYKSEYNGFRVVCISEKSNNYRKENLEKTSNEIISG